MNARLPPLPPDPPARRAAARRSLGPCPLCGRELIQGPSVEEHHLVPRSLGGRETVWLHCVCHRKIHAELTERQLRDRYATIEALKHHPAIAEFRRWIARKPPEFVTRTRRRNSRA